MKDKRLADSIIWDELETIGDKDCWAPLPIIVGIACPVDVYILNDAHEILAFESEREQVSDTGMILQGFAGSSDVISWITEEGMKMFFIPPGSDASYIYIVAYEDEELEPEMTISISTFNPTSDEFYNNIRFEKVELEDGKEF